MGAELFQAERRTDKHNENISLFRNIANAPNGQKLDYAVSYYSHEMKLREC
jgi:hypothetical protein